MEALPPPPPAEVVYHEQTVPDLLDPIVIEAANTAPPFEVPVVTTAVSEQSTPTDVVVSEVAPQPETTKFQRVRQKLGKIVVGESLGTAIDIASMATGVPLPIREVAGSAIDTKIYGSPLEQTADAEQQQTRLRRVGRKAGSIALFAATGVLAQKYGSEVADHLSSHLNHGALGEYVTPLTSKFGAMTGVNSVVKKIIRP